jgi:steroid 5-alpha reductase family enzyme
MLLLWLISLWQHDASIVDPFWGAGFALLSWLSWLQRDDPASLRVGLLLVMVTAWGIRLSLYLLWRNWGHGEDRRYSAMRHHHGASFWWISLGTVFGLQALLLWVIACPVQWCLLQARQPALGAADGLGLALWLIGLTFESVGDWQLARFKADPANRGKVLDQGLWRYTRHPNYFGDFCVWWGIYFVAAGGGAWWTIFSPLLMIGLLMRVSGVRLLESTISERRPAYRDYVRRTNAFFPGPPRR